MRDLKAKSRFFVSLKSGGIAFLILILAIGFQNCTSAPWNVVGSVGFEHKQRGNGGGYEGKLSYYRFVPDLICSGEKTFKEMLVFDQDQVWLYQNTNSGSTCEQSRQQLEITDVGTSPFQNEFLFVHDYLYARYDYSPGQPPELLAESLCRDNWKNPTFEIVNHHNYKTGEATTRLYYLSSDGQVKVHQDSETQRLLTPVEVKYQSFNQVLNYQINLANGAGEYSRLFSGEISSVGGELGSTIKAGPIQCITGGGLDNSIWPLKKVAISPTISNFFVHPTENDIYFEDRDPKSVNWWRPFVLKDEVTLIDISASVFNTRMYVSSNIPIENSKWMAFYGLETNGTPYFGGNVYIYRPDDPSTLRTLVRGQSLSSFIPNQDIVSSKITQLTESEFGFWIVNRNYVDSVLVETTFYRIYNWKTRQHRDYLSAQPAFGFAQSVYFSKSLWPTGTVADVKALPDGRLVLSYMDISSRVERTRILPTMPKCTPSRQVMRSDASRFFISQISQEAVIEFSCEGGARKVLGISLESGVFYTTGGSDTLIWNSDTGEDFLVAEALGGLDPIYFNYNPQNIRLFNSKSGTSVASQIDPHLNNSGDQTLYTVRNQYFPISPYTSTEIRVFTKNNAKYLTGFSNGPNWEVRLKNLNSGVETTVCKNAVGQKTKLENLADDQVVLVTFEPGVKVSMYEVSTSGDCQLLNSAPVHHNSIRHLIPTKSGIGIALMAPTSTIVYGVTRYPDDVYFLNKDGRVPLYINLDNPDFGVIVDLQVSFDHSKLYILGTGLKPSIYQTLYWLGL